MTTFSIDKDPDAVLDYSIDWSSWLDGDTILTSTWSISGPDSSLAIDSDTNSSTAATVWLSGGTKNLGYILANRITTAGGRQDDRSVTVMMVDK